MRTWRGDGTVINNFALLVSHSLLLLVCWRLIGRADLDDDRADAGASTGFARPAAAEKQPTGK